MHESPRVRNNFVGVRERRSPVAKNVDFTAGSNVGDSPGQVYRLRTEDSDSKRTASYRLPSGGVVSGSNRIDRTASGPVFPRHALIERGLEQYQVSNSRERATVDVPVKPDGFFSQDSPIRSPKLTEVSSSRLQTQVSMQQRHFQAHQSVPQFHGQSKIQAQETSNLNISHLRSDSNIRPTLSRTEPNEIQDHRHEEPSQARIFSARPEQSPKFLPEVTAIYPIAQHVRAPTPEPITRRVNSQPGQLAPSKTAFRVFYKMVDGKKLGSKLEFNGEIALNADNFSCDEEFQSAVKKYMGDHSGTNNSHRKASPVKSEVQNSTRKALQTSEFEVNPNVDLLLRKYTGNSNMVTPQKDTAKKSTDAFIRQPSENVALSPDRSRNQDFPTPNHLSTQKKTTPNPAPPNPGPPPNQMQKFPQKEERVMSFKYSDRDLSDTPSQNLDETYQNDLKKALSLPPFKNQFPGAFIISKSDVRTEFSVQDVSNDPNVQYIKYFETPSKVVVCKISVNLLTGKNQPEQKSSH